MDITIHDRSGSVMPHHGLEGHIDPERHLFRMGYEIIDAPVPDGDYGDGELFAVRLEGEVYAADEYDVAEID